MSIILLAFFILCFIEIIKNNNQKEIVQLLYYILLFIVLASYSLFESNEPQNIFRFFIIMIFITCAYFVNVEIKYINYFLFALAIQALVIIFIEIYLILFFDIESYRPIRSLFKFQGWGDIYTFNGSFWRVQLRGNGILPVGFFVGFLYLTGKKRFYFCSLMFSALIVAGNFAFQFGIFVFFIVYFIFCIHWYAKYLKLLLFTFVTFLLPISVIAFNYLLKIIEQKSINSNAIRLDQIDVLFDDLNSNLYSILLGRGLGNTLDIITDYRDYRGVVYFELQSLYILNQLGAIFFFLFIIINVFLVCKFFRNIKIKTCYLAYLTYSFFNPYIWDTNHIVVIITLSALQKFYDKHDVREGFKKGEYSLVN